MSKVDEVKEFIGYLKVLLVLLLATSISLIGWSINNYQTAENILVVSAVILVILLSIFIFLINKKIKKDIKSLRDL